MTLGEFFNSKVFNELDSDCELEIVYYDNNGYRRSLSRGNKYYVKDDCSAYTHDKIENIDLGKYEGLGNVRSVDDVTPVLTIVIDAYSYDLQKIRKSLDNQNKKTNHKNTNSSNKSTSSKPVQQKTNTKVVPPKKRGLFSNLFNNDDDAVCIEEVPSKIDD